jgi:hypothetical protein
MENYTPLPSDNSSPVSSAVAQPVVTASPKKNNLANILTVIGISLFVLSIGYSVTSTQIGTKSKAAGVISPTPQPHYNVTVLDKYNTFPQKYKDTEIPLRIWDEAKATLGDMVNNTDNRQFAIKTVIKYFIYNDALAAAGGASAINPDTLSFSQMNDAINNGTLEEDVKTKAITNFDFCYIQARFALGSNPEGVKKQIPDPEKKAKELINTYKQKIQQNPDQLESIVQESNTNADMKILNGTEKNDCLKNYIYDDEKYFVDKAFNTFLLNTPVNQVSDVYTVKPDSLPPDIYVIVYPTRVDKHDVNSLSDLITQGVKNFKF